MSFDLTLTPAVKIQCKNCYSCCVGLLVEIELEDLDLWESLDLLNEIQSHTEINPEDRDRWNHPLVLKQKDDGSCTFLCNGFCTIYEVRPRVCRDFEYLGKHCKDLRNRCGLDEEET